MNERYIIRSASRCKHQGKIYGGWEVWTWTDDTKSIAVPSFGFGPAAKKAAQAKCDAMNHEYNLAASFDVAHAADDAS